MIIVDRTRLPQIATNIEGELLNQRQFSHVVCEYVDFDAISELLGSVECFLERLGAVIEIWEGKPNYRRMPWDRIQMPPVDWLPLVETWWSSLLHEVVHWSEWRCDWRGTVSCGELRAEIGQAILEPVFGLPHCKDMTNYEKWIDAWLAGIESSPTVVLEMTEAAIESVEFLLKIANSKRTRSKQDNRTEAAKLSLFERAQLLVTESLQQ